MKDQHEIRDPVHGFIRLDSDERSVLDSRPLQRLRYLHQLALSYLVYPGATHRRFEHSLGTMELATRIFDSVRQDHKRSEGLRESLPELFQSAEKIGYWRRVLRMAALCHDLGHLPFSHAAEKEMLPPGWSHETMTLELIFSPQMAGVWDSGTIPLRPKDIAKLAVGHKALTHRNLAGEHFSNWEAILSEIIVGDAFGADRMDYLLRDSHHAGVAYGRFDQYRLIDTLCILPSSRQSTEPTPGVEIGGLHSAEALVLARYFMHTQVYFHPVRRAYDEHLVDFLRAWLPEGKLSIELGAFLALTDETVTAAMLDLAFTTGSKGCEEANRIVGRRHFKVAYERNNDDLKLFQQPGRALAKALCKEFGAENVRQKDFREKDAVFTFPVLDNNGEILSAESASTVLPRVPPAMFDYVFVKPELREQAREWITSYKAEVLDRARQEESE